MQSQEVRSRFLKFFEARGHKIIPSASLVPANDPSVLFNTAGMQPLVPYLLGQVHPMGNRIVDIQKCVRTGDLDDIGDNRHFSFFEMMGNWSLGDYFKDEAIKWSYEFLTSKDEGLGLDPKRLYFTIFEGDENAPYDEESKKIWMSLGIPENRIYALPAEDNWWSPGDNGPCGPCSEMFYDMTGDVGDLSHEEFLKAVKDERVIEIWNDVFMEYEKKDAKVVGKLKQKNVDTGAGLERMTAVMQGVQTAYDTDIFKPLMNAIEKMSSSVGSIRSQRIIADHLRTSTFMIADGVRPSNNGRGYVLRRLLRRSIIQSDKIQLNTVGFLSLVDLVVIKYASEYPDSLLGKNTEIKLVIEHEINQFKSTLENGLKEFKKLTHNISSVNGLPLEKVKTINGLPINQVKSLNGVLLRKELDGKDAFYLFETFGFPREVMKELCDEEGVGFDEVGFEKALKEHQEKSRTASAGMFKGGLANHNEQTIRLHTAHHLLLAGLQAVVDKNIKQRGSNITEERLRIDFLCDHKLTDDEKQKVEAFVNEKIEQGLDVIRREMPLAEAEKLGAEMEFGAKYPDIVSVYFIEDKDGNPVSKEFCGGPHVKNTAELYSSSRENSRDEGPFKIQKEEAVSAGVRRIKAVLL